MFVETKRYLINLANVTEVDYGYMYENIIRFQYINGYTDVTVTDMAKIKEIIRNGLFAGKPMVSITEMEVEVTND